MKDKAHIGSFRNLAALRVVVASTPFHAPNFLRDKCHDRVKIELSDNL